ncbi:MAG: response regulator [Candidatus Latescibacteria bacterium]|jgi:two-component system OmpR family response regulator/two-component system alkaline phosphatase synthesis response regulator PhoP|nr:response regulator [Candidatus Latescibacterota bacterium]
MQILLADDEPQILHLYHEILEGCGCEVTTARDGHEALDRFAAGDHDVVVMDLHMPKMSGFDCIAEMQKQRRDVQVIILTGYYPDEVVADRVQGLGLEVVEALRKPVTITALWNAVSRCRRRADN